MNISGKNILYKLIFDPKIISVLSVLDIICDKSALQVDADCIYKHFLVVSNHSIIEH